MLGGLSRKPYAISLALLLVILIIGVGSALPASKMYKVKLSSVNGEVDLDSVDLVEGYPNLPSRVFPDDYVLRVYSFDEEVYYELPTRFSYEVFLSAGEECFIRDGLVETTKCGEKSYVEMNDSVVVLGVPYFPNAKFLRFYEPNGRLIIEKDISSFSCGNNVCDSHETANSCLQDCARGKYVFYKVMLVFGLILFILAILVFIFWEKHLERKDIKEKITKICRWLKWQN